MGRRSNPGFADTLFKPVGGLKSGLLSYFFLAEGLGEAAAACFGWNISFFAAAHFCC
jgi:hypothetical protein